MPKADWQIGELHRREMRKRAQTMVERGEPLYTVEQATIQCNICGLISHHPKDVNNRYCGNCHVFLEDVARDIRLMLAQDDLPAPAPPAA